jgi:hypothetical protein
MLGELWPKAVTVVGCCQLRRSLSAWSRMRCWRMMMIRWLCVNGKAPSGPSQLMSRAARWHIARARSSKAAWGGVHMDWALSCRMDPSCMSQPCVQVNVGMSAALT